MGVISPFVELLVIVAVSVFLTGTGALTVALDLRLSSSLRASRVGTGGRIAASAAVVVVGSFALTAAFFWLAPFTQR